LFFIDEAVMLDASLVVCENPNMGDGNSRFQNQKAFSMQPSDLNMWQTSKILPACHCLDPQYGNKRFGQLRLHSEFQNTECEAWNMLKDLIGAAATQQASEFAPGLEMPPELWRQIITLPASISKLTSVRKLYLYGSHLVRIPPEIGQMSSLEDLDLYTSYCLHWLPYEVTHCVKLKKSRFSTRALYGNYKYRPPFPKLDVEESKGPVPAQCSVCREPTDAKTVHQAWISLRVATDVLPLLVNACSDDCIRQLPPPAFGYVSQPHSGGLNVAQPAISFGPPRPNPSAS
jgi:hypothetical protein